MGRPRKYRRTHAIRETILDEWDDDVPIFVERIKVGVTDEAVHQALDSIRALSVKPSEKFEGFDADERF